MTNNELVKNDLFSFLYAHPDLFSLELTEIDLQQFAADDEGRTEDPTEQKKRKAREEGKVVLSRDLSGALVLILTCVMVYMLSKGIFKSLSEMIHYIFTNFTDLNVAAGNKLFQYSLLVLFKIIGPILGIIFVISFLVTVVQTGIKFSAKPVSFDIKRISPNIIRFFQRSVFSIEAMFNLVKNIIKIIIIGSIAYITISGKYSAIVATIQKPVEISFQFFCMLAFEILIKVGIVMLLLAIPDYLFLRWRHKQSLKMTKQEIKEERKQMEGDPLLKSRLRERYRDILRRTMLQEVPKADVIITNPTHFAVALKYEADSMAAPLVTAKGQDYMAQKIKEIASENGIYIYEDKPLARALYAQVEIGQEIPDKLFVAVAEILAFVYRVNENVS